MRTYTIWILTVLSFFHLSSGPKHDQFIGTRKIIDKESYYLSGELGHSTVESTNKTVVDFIRHHDERCAVKVFFDKKLEGANVTWMGMINHEQANSTMYDNWILPPLKYLAFLADNNNVMIFETTNPGHDNLTIGYEEYT